MEGSTGSVVRGNVISGNGGHGVELALGGSFAPGKVFTVTAYVSDPAPGQSLALELPAGMALVDGQEIQAVPAPPAEGNPVSLVYWRARVLRPGEFPVRVQMGECRLQFAVSSGRLGGQQVQGRVLRRGLEAAAQSPSRLGEVVDAQCLLRLGPIGAKLPRSPSLTPQVAEPPEHQTDQQRQAGVPRQWARLRVL